MSSTGSRVLVYLKSKSASKSNENIPFLAKFTQSVLDFFYDDERNFGEVAVSLGRNRLEISMPTQENSIRLKRPSFCPITNLTQDDIEKLPDEIENRGIDVGAAVILESSDNKILLTRRSKSLRTFPNVWVPPGGHIEQNESFVEAGLRELKEETGLDIRQHQCVSSDLNVLALWESVYPPKLNMGLPKRHHIVVYLHGKLTPDLTSDQLNNGIKLEPSEADACAWIDKDLVKAIVAAKEEDGSNLLQNSMPEYIRGFSFDESGAQTFCDIAVEPLLRVCGVTSQVERVSTGTKYALEEWLQLT